ncbi:MAG: hypothetical protein Q7S02_03605 [bacterium]|nr:hypothetical protein [bacterium]
MLTAVGGALAFVGATTVLVVVMRVFPRLARLPKRAEAPAPDHEFALKERLLLERMKRRMRGWGTRMSRRASTMGKGLEARLEHGYRRLRLLAQEYVATKSASPAVTCETHIAAADAAIAQDELEEAEEHYLACLKLDPKHRDAYLGLAALYRKRKEDGLAEETLRFLRKLCPEDHEVASMLAGVLRDREKGSAALKEIQAAIALAPRNPKYLDFAADLAIVERNRRLATRFLDQLREANPENQKLQELEERIAAIEGGKAH